MECAASSRSVGVSLGPPFTWSLSPMKRGSATYQPAKRLLTLLLLLDRTAYANEPLSPTGCDPLPAISCFVRCPPVPHHLLRHKSWVIHSPGCCCCCSLKLRRNLIEFESKWMKRAASFFIGTRHAGENETGAMNGWKDWGVVFTHVTWSPAVWMNSFVGRKFDARVTAFGSGRFADLHFFEKI